MAIVRIELDETTHKRLKILAIERGTSLKELIPMILREYSTKKGIQGIEGRGVTEVTEVTGVTGVTGVTEVKEIEEAPLIHFDPNAS